MDSTPLLDIIAVSGMGGFVNLAISNTSLTLKRTALMLLYSCFTACTAAALLSGKISVHMTYGIAAVVGFSAESILIGVHKLATSFSTDPLKFIDKLQKKK